MSFSRGGNRRAIPGRSSPAAEVFTPLSAALHLKSDSVETTMFDQPHCHPSQPHLYYVAPESLSAEESATPLHDVSSKRRNKPAFLAIFVFLFWGVSVAFA